MKTALPYLKPKQFAAGILLSSSILFGISALVALWPDKVPARTSAYYRLDLFNVTVSCEDRSCAGLPETGAPPTSSDTKKDTAAAANANVPATSNVSKTGTPKKTATPADSKKERQKSSCLALGHIHLGALLLILVALGGFLGSAIYVAKSFTTFVGLGTFDESWVLWYWIKPLLAAALAVIVYLAFNDSPEKVAEGINLNRIVAIAALTGLFSDDAISKLKDVFNEIVKPSTDSILRQQKSPKVNLQGILPEKIDTAQANEVSIPGENLDAIALNVSINDAAIKDLKISPTELRFAYVVPETDKAKTEFVLTVTDKKGKELARKIWTKK